MKNKSIKEEHFSWRYINYPPENNWAEDDDILEDIHYLLVPMTKQAKQVLRNEIRIYLLETQEFDMIIASITNILNNLLIYIYK